MAVVRNDLLGSGVQVLPAHLRAVKAITATVQLETL